MNRIEKIVDVIHNEQSKKDITIIHIADLHFNKNTKVKFLNRIKEEIYKNNPDYIMISGDIIDTPNIINDKYKIKELLLFLTELGNRFKILISLGNHDIFLNQDLKFFKKLNDLKNIYILDNECYQDDYIYVSGITLTSDYYYNIEKCESVTKLEEILTNNKNIIKNLPITKPKVLLIHSPICLLNKVILDKLNEYDLILSGHTHDGMVLKCLRSFFKKNRGIIAPNKKLFPEIARGKIEKYIKNKKITIIINGGLTKLSLCSSKIFSKLNFIYNISINKIIITKKRGKYYE